MSLLTKHLWPLLALLFFVTLFLAVGFVAPKQPETVVEGKVSWVVDGDTFHIGKVKIRLWGVDAPEHDTRDGPGSTQHLRKMIDGQPVRCVIVDTSYERLVGQCRMDGRDINAAMISDGWARDYRHFTGGAYATEEATARAVHKGMWR